jgi:hypothetical protein
LGDRLKILIIPLLFGALFLQFPLSHSLPENNTTWYILSQFNFYYQKLFNLGFSGTSFFPVQNAVGLSDTGLIHFLIYLPFRIIFKNELWAYYFYLVSIFSLNFFVFNKFLKQVFKLEKSSVYGALVFSCSNFVFGNIGDPPVIFYPFFLLTFIYLDKYFHTKNYKHLIYASLLCGLQVFSFSYVYFFLNICVFLYFLLFRYKVKDAAFFFTINLLIGLLFFYPYINKFKNGEMVGLYNNKANATIHSFMELKDFFKKVPGNIYGREGDLNNLYQLQIYAKILESKNELHYLYPVVSSTQLGELVPPVNENILNEKVIYHQLRKSGFVGFSVLLLSILGLLMFSRNKYKNFVNGLFLVGLFLCIGPYFQIGDDLWRTPLYFAYEHIPGFSFFRVPSRAFMLCLISVSVYSSVALSKIKYKGVFYLFIIVALLENIPFPMKKWKYFSPPQNKISKFLNTQDNKVLLYLPSDLGVYIFNDDKDVFAFQREYIYMNWKNYHSHSILNGMAAYLPPSRIEIQKILKNKNPFLSLKAIYNLDFVYFKESFFDKDFDNITLQDLIQNKNLSLKVQDDDSYLFKIN